MNSSQLGAVQFCVLAAAILGAVGGAKADPIPSDILVTGSYLFDVAGSSVLDTGTQSGSFYSITNGIRSESTYLDGSLQSGSNPVTGTFGQHGGGVVGGGDGFGGSSSGSAGVTGPGRFRADFDQTLADGAQPFAFSNSSATQAYLVTMSLTYDHSVTALFGESWVRSDIEVNLNGSNAFTDAEIISDLLYGNEKDGVALGVSGGTVSDSGVRTFSFTLAPLSVSQIEIDYTVVGEAYADPDASITASANYFLSIDNFQAVPEPAAGSCLIIFAIGVCFTRRRAG